jgi:HD-GYP domain-containing protein (c-di-GMP phosphodiesterase class II)
MLNTIRVRTNILITIATVVVILALTMLGLQIYLGERLAQKATQQAFSHVAEKIQASIQSRDALAKERLRLIEYYPDIVVPQFTGQMLSIERVKQFAHAMGNDAQIYAIYTGYPNGDLFEVISMSCAADLYSSMNAPLATRWIVLRVFDTPRHGRIKVIDFLDEEFEIIATRDENTNYDSRIRPWFVQAQGRDDVVRSAPYLFSSIHQQGITFSRKLNTPEGEGVIALDYTLHGLSALLKAQSFFATGYISLFTADGDLSATSGRENVTDMALKAAILENKINHIIHYESAGEARYGLIVPLDQGVEDGSLIALSVSAKEMLDPYMDSMIYSFLSALVVLLLMYPIVRYATGLIVHPIQDLMNENEKIKNRKYNEVKPIKTNIVEFIDLSSSQLAMSNSILEYEESQKELLKSFVRLIADAIDEKSPYTGGHCKRVPVIAMMLAKVADAQNEGSLSSFSFPNQDEWEAFEMGAWLHDCGKITTPEFVVDKATKLETLYNRIHEVRMRFEVIWRDIDIQYFSRISQGESKMEAEGWRDEQQRQLIDEFGFIARCNIGGELMGDVDIQRIQTIAQRTWLRHFDDRLGLSDQEILRYKASPPPALPVIENLLADKPEHRIERFDFDYAAYIQDGFKLHVPELLYNYGELYNLSIRKGTLSPEDRFKINEHVIMSIKLLEQLPLPDAMRRIPEYAGTHHETMDGSGYPRGLTRNELSIPARIMAIADIFEALTASDRPYKRGKTLTEALGIMRRMVDEQHIDADLFALFLRSGVYLEYSMKYLKPEQLDDVDVDLLLGSKTA